MESNAFEQILGSFQNTYTEAKSFSNWAPEADGPYTLRIVSKAFGASQNKDMTWMKLNCKVEGHQDPEVNGKEWGAFFFTSKNFGFLKDFLAVATGVAPTSVVEAFRALDGMLGALVMVEKKTITTKSNKTAVNVTLIRVLQQPTQATTAA